MKKAQWKQRALVAEAKLRLGPPLTFDTLEVCWSTRAVTYQGRTITAPPGPDCLALPIVQVTNPLERRGMER